MKIVKWSPFELNVQFQYAQQRFNKNTNRIYRVYGHPRAMKIRTFSPRPAHVRGVAGSRISGDVPNSGVSRKTPQKASECYQNVEKAPKNSTEFLHICQKHPKKLPIFFLEIAENFSVFVTSTQKSSRKAPEFWRDFNLASSLAHSGQPTK